jgi:hypothetical protein
MYHFTEAEFAALEAAKSGTLVSGTAEYQAAIDAIAANLRFVPHSRPSPLPSAIPS